MSASLPPKTVVREIAPGDAETLADVIAIAGAGLPTLPQGVEAAEHMIEESASGARPTYVLERLDTRQVVGLSSILIAFPHSVHSLVCEIEQIDGQTRLRPNARFAGTTELCSLFLAPEMRGGGNGRLLSLARFFAIHAAPGRFHDTLMVEMRGVLDEEGVSPLWRDVCERVLGIDHFVAHRRLRQDPAYLAEQLTEDGWLDISAVPEALRGLLGQVHQNTVPARRMLEAEGFAATGFIDLLDAGPIMACTQRDARLLQQIREVRVTQLVDTDAPREMLIATAGSAALRCCRGAIDAEGRLAMPAARALGVEPGDTVRFATLRPA